MAETRLVYPLTEIFQADRIKTYIDLYETMCTKFREDQFRIENIKNGFRVTVTTLPSNFQLPTKISYWNVELKKGKIAA